MERIPEFIGNHLFLVTLFVSLLILLSWNLFGSAVSGIRQITPAELVRLMNREEAVVLDIRSPEEFNKGHILDAVNLPAQEIEGRKEELAAYKERTLVVYCNLGNTSTRIGRLLKLDGFGKVYGLKGGIQAWQGGNLPLTRNN